jgi:hypothetical protein
MRKKNQLRFKFVCAHSGIEPTSLTIQSPPRLRRQPPRLRRKKFYNLLYIYRLSLASAIYDCVKTYTIVHGQGHPRTQGLFGKDPGIGWSRDSTKINCPWGGGVACMADGPEYQASLGKACTCTWGSGKVSNYMLPQKTLNFKYQEWGFYPANSILYFCLLLNYKNTVACYQQSSQETNKMYTLNFEVGYSLTNIFSCQTGQSSTFVHFHFYLFLKYAIRFFV